MFTIQPFTPTDANYRRVVAIQKRIYPDVPISVSRAKHNDQTYNPKYLRQRLVVEQDGQIVAVALYLEPSWSYRSGKYQIEIDVDPDWQRQGIGTMLYDHIMAALAERDPKPTLLVTESRENLLQSIRFLEKRGFQSVMRTPTSQIDLTTFDAGQYAKLIDRVLASGIEIQTLAVLRERDPDWQRKLYDLDWEGTQDEPLPDAPTKSPFDEYVKWYFDSPEFFPDGWFIAVDGNNGAFAGMSQIMRHAEEGEEVELNTGYTCVARAYRRRGVATALKVKGLEFAQQYGARHIRTGNEENNPMYQINLNIGFQPLPAWLSFEKRLDDVEESV